MNSCVKTEINCNESVNNKCKIMRNTSNNESEQIMKLIHRIHVCLISTSDHMLGRVIWDKLPECIFQNYLNLPE